MPIFANCRQILKKMSSLFNNNSKKKKKSKKNLPKPQKISKKVKKCHLNIWAQRDKQTQRAGTRPAPTFCCIMPEEYIKYKNSNQSQNTKKSNVALLALATSEVLFLGDQQKSIALGKHFLFLKDNTKNFTIDNILSHKFDDPFSTRNERYYFCRLR